MKTKHTPGPWTIRGPLFDSENPNEMTGYFLYGLGHLWIANILGEHVEVPREECEANALLMSAAPELLSALKAARDLIYAETVGHDEPQSIRVLAQIETALGKAEGRYK